MNPSLKIYTIDYGSKSEETNRNTSIPTFVVAARVPVVDSTGAVSGLLPTSPISWGSQNSSEYHSTLGVVNF